MDIDQTPCRILIIEDNVGFAQSLRRSLRAQASRATIRFEIEIETEIPYEIEATDWAAELASGFDVAILDQRLGPVEGLSLIEPIKAANPNTAVIILTGFESPEDGVRALKAGAWRYLPKPPRPDEILIAIQTWLEWRRTWSERAWLRVLHDFSAAVQGLDDPQAVAESIVDAARRLGFANTRLWRLENGREQNEAVAPPPPSVPPPTEPPSVPPPARGSGDGISSLKPPPDFGGRLEGGNFGETLRGWAQRGLDITPEKFARATIPMAESVYSQVTLSGKEPKVFVGRELGPGYADDLLYPHGHRPPTARLWVDLPLWAGEHCLGKLSLDGHPEILSYNEDERSLLTLLSQQAAAALARVEDAAERRRRAEETEEAARSLRLLHRMGRELPVLMELDAQKGWLATLTALTAQDGLRCNRALFFRVEPGDHGRVARGQAGVGELTPEAARRAWERDVARGWTLDDYLIALKRDEIEPTPAHRFVQKLAFPISEERNDPFSQLLREGKAIRLRGEDWLRLPKGYRKRFQADETVLVPAFLDENVVGILAVDNFADQKPITPQVLQHLQLFVDQSLLIRQEVRQRRRLRQLLGAGQMLSQAAAQQPLGQTLNRLCEIACQITGADLATIYPFQLKTRKYDAVNTGAYGHRAYRHPSDRTRTHGVSGYVLEHGWLEVENIDTAKALPDSKPWREHPFFQREKAKAILATRLEIGSDIAGLLYLNWRQPHAFETNEREAVRLLASLAANAVRSAQGFAHLIENLDEQQRQLITQATELSHLQRIEKAALKSSSDRSDLIRLILQTANEALQIPRPSYTNLDLRQAGSHDEVEHYSLDEQENLHRERRSPSALIAHVIKNRRLYSIADVRSGRWRKYFRKRPEIRSVLSVPLCAGNRCFGAIKVESPESDRFQAEHEEKLNRVASTATLALEHLEQQEELARLLEVAKALTIPSDLEDTLAKIRQQLLQTAPGLDAFAIWYRDLDARQLRLGTHDGLRDHESITQPLPEKDYDSPVTRMLTRETPIWSTRITRSQTLRGSFIGREGIRSCAAIPLRVENEAVGVMFLNYRTMHVFSDREKRLFRLFAELVAIALQDETLRAVANKQSKRLQLAQDLQTAMSKAGAEDDLLEPVLLKLREHFQDSVASILIYEPERQQLRVPNIVQKHYAADLGDRSDHIFIPLERRSITTHVLSQALAERGNIIYRSDDVHGDPNYLKLREQTNSQLSAAMVAEGEVLGILSLESRRPAGFREEDEKLFETLAMATAQALARVKHAQAAARSTAVALMGAQGAEVGHEMGHTIRAMRHQIYKLKTQSRLDAKQLSPLALIEKEMDRAKGLIDLPPLPDLRDPNTYPDVGDHALLHETIRDETERIRERTDPNNPQKWRLHYHFASQSPQIAIHPEWLRVVIRHLSRNALNAMPEGGDLTFSTEVAEEQVIVRVSDTGKGFRPEIVPFLFRERIPHSDGDRRKGLGLLLVALVVEAHGGGIRLESTPPGQGSCVRFTLPKVKRSAKQETNHDQL